MTEAKAVKTAEENKTIKMSDKDFDKAAKAFGENLKAMGKREIKIPVIEGAEPVVSVIINGYRWNIERGKRVEVPVPVVNVLEESNII